MPSDSFETNSDAGSALCMTCGLCCEDAFHSYAVLRPQDIKRARELGLPVLSGKQAGFALPCPKLVNCCCSIYSKRPWACEGYKCQLLIKVETRQIEPDDAFAKVVVARNLFNQCERDKAAPVAEIGLIAAERKLRSTTLRLYLDRHFMNPQDRKLVHQTIVRDTSSEILEI